MITPSAELREAVASVTEAIEAEPFYSECGTSAIAQYEDEGRNYFVTFFHDGLNVHTMSLDVPRESPDHGWQTGWEC